MKINLTNRQKNIIDIISSSNNASISEVKVKLTEDISTPTLNRELASLVSCNYLVKEGAGRSTSYRLTQFYKLFTPIDTVNYFEIDPDNRKAIKSFNFDIFNILERNRIFNVEEQGELEKLKHRYQKNISDFPHTLYQKELERLTIELSWKSAQIEGNTYSLLETEILFLENETAKGKPIEDANMLLNHKYALNYLLDNKDLTKIINVKLIEEIHSILVKDLKVGRNIRKRSVGITGTAYKPLDNEHQIKEALEKSCSLINSRENGFEKALYAVLLISYIQPFEDGNKRTARMISNAMLIAYGTCPLSYRSTDSIEYKKAMLLFYEQNNLSIFKDIFLEQNKFSVNNYFT